MKYIIVFLGIGSLILNLVYHFDYHIDEASLVVLSSGTIPNLVIDDSYFGIIFDYALKIIFGFNITNLNEYMKVVGIIG